MPRMTRDYPKCFVGNLHRDLTLESFWEWLHKEGGSESFRAIHDRYVPADL